MILPPEICIPGCLFCFFWPWPLIMHACSVISNSLQPCGLFPSAFPVHGIFQERILEWVAISYSKGLTQGLNMRLLIYCIGGRILYLCATCEFPVCLFYWSMIALQCCVRTSIVKQSKSAVKVKVKVFQSCLNLCDFMNYSPPGPQYGL